MAGKHIAITFEILGDDQETVIGRMARYALPVLPAVGGEFWLDFREADPLPGEPSWIADRRLLCRATAVTPRYLDNRQPGNLEVEATIQAVIVRVGSPI